MKKLLLLILFISPVILSSSKNEQRVIFLHPINERIDVDGVIEEIWNHADSAYINFQMQPYFRQAPSEKTVVKVLADNSSLYCLVISYSKNNHINKAKGTLDNFSGDVVSLYLDTFNDKKSAYRFSVGAGGAAADSRLMDDARNNDYSWDGVWFSDSKIYDWGYVVEMEIPFKSIQYDEAAEYWGVDFDRWIPSNSEDLYWCEYERNEGMRVSNYGKMVFNKFKPTDKGLNLEVYPVGIAKTTYLENGKYKSEGDLGLDILYNPSPKLKFQLTANPDFAQIEADPYDFNITRYESFFSEKRPFFTEGSEIFSASGKQTNTGFYSPLELFYSRRIGKLLPDGTEIPLTLGTKAFGRINDWEYGGFLAKTEGADYFEDDELKHEEKALFGSARLKKQIFGNSTIGVLFVGKQTRENTYGVIDIDGAFRESTWQLAYQFARSIKNSDGDYAASAGFTSFSKKWLSFARGRYIGKDFDIKEVGYVPWVGTAELATINGPIWYFDEGYIKQIILYGGFALNYEDVDNYTDHAALFGFNMQLRNNWGYEINISYGKSLDEEINYTSYSTNLSSWYNISPKWSANLWGGYSRTYNFDREFLAFYSWMGLYFNWKATDVFDIGTNYNMYVEGNPEGNIENITYNARPYFSVTPINNLNIRVYVDNVFETETDHLERVIAGLLFSYNFLPKSWIYLALNEVQDRSEEKNYSGDILPSRIHVKDRAGVFKIKYLYYF